MGLRDRDALLRGRPELRNEPERAQAFRGRRGPRAAARRTTMVAATVLLLLAAPSASAAFPAAVSASFGIQLQTDPPSAPIPRGGSATFPLQVYIESEGPMACVMDSNVPIHLTLGGLSEGLVTGGIEPETAVFRMPAGLHGPMGTWVSPDESAEVSIQIAEDYPLSHPHHTLRIRAEFFGNEAPPECAAVEWRDNSAAIYIHIEVTEEG